MTVRPRRRDPEIGDIVAAMVPTGGYPHPKQRPAIIVARYGDQYGIVSLSGKSYHPSGITRDRIAHPERCGLSAGGWIRDSRLRWIKTTAVRSDPIGRIDRDAVTLLAGTVVDMTNDDVCNLLLNARP